MASAAWLAALAGVAAQERAPGLVACRLDGVEHTAWCGRVQRALDPARPGGPRIDVHFAVLPALARNRHDDPVFFLAGGPGQSAIDLAGPVAGMLSRLLNRRDVVLVDQRGSGRSASLACDADDPRRPLADRADPAVQRRQLAACRERLQGLPHGDLRQYLTSHAAGDLDAVRAALGAERLNLVAVSYGTRLALEVMRRHPERVRRAVLDGVAPPDMRLPEAFAVDNQAALDARLAACEQDAACRARHPGLRGRWRALVSTLPRTVTVQHPVSGRPETLTIDADLLRGWLRAPLYVPALAAALPAAMAAAADGRFEPLAALATSVSAGAGDGFSAGLHFSVICAEDVGAPGTLAEAAPPATDFGDSAARLYRDVCADWPRGVPPAGFSSLPPAQSPVLVLSGGADPATPPRHGERVVRALGPQARHVVSPEAGHGLLGLRCMGDVVFRFIDADRDADALRVDAGCVAAVPRPPAPAWPPTSMRGPSTPASAAPTAPGRVAT